MLGAKLPAPTALESPLQFLPPSLSVQGAGESQSQAITRVDGGRLYPSSRACPLKFPSKAPGMQPIRDLFG